MTEMRGSKNGNGVAPDRRTRRRFKIQEELRYKLLFGDRIAETGTGKTLNISSSGVWFTTETQIEPGTPVELSMIWPARVHDVCPLKLMIYGCVIRSDAHTAVLSIERYEFRTRGSAPAPLYQENGFRLPI